jgi:hypothetical protein
MIIIVVRNQKNYLFKLHKNLAYLKLPLMQFSMLSKFSFFSSLRNMLLLKSLTTKNFINSSHKSTIPLEKLITIDFYKRFKQFSIR